MNQNVVLFPVPLESLTDTLRDVVRQELDTHKVGLENETTYLSPTKAAEFLGVSKVTIWSYTKKGILTKYMIGGLPRYRKDELISAMKPIR